MTERTGFKFPYGARVQKMKGYRWPGVVVSQFLTSDGKERYVVECTVIEVRGALHIYGPKDLELRP